MDPEPFTKTVTTNHYKFNIEIQERRMPHSFYFRVGNKKTPCLDFFVLMPDVPEFLRDTIHIANLGNVKVLEECVLNEITGNYFEKHSFGKELINTSVYIIRKHIPHVKLIKLTDESYIPCKRAHNETLDLLTYSIALYGKTWYEKTFNAYFEPKEKYEKYLFEVGKYISKDFKDSYVFEDFLKQLVSYPNEFAMTSIFSDLDSYKSLFESSETFPIFFSKLSKSMKREDKCRFFKHWLENFIHKLIPSYDRVWLFEIDKVVFGGKRTRKNKKKL
jgi:hypothetical protein